MPAGQGALLFAAVRGDVEGRAAELPVGVHGRKVPFADRVRIWTVALGKEHLRLPGGFSRQVADFRLAYVPCIQQKRPHQDLFPLRHPAYFVLRGVVLCAHESLRAENEGCTAYDVRSARSDEHGDEYGVHCGSFCWVEGANYESIIIDFSKKSIVRGVVAKKNTP